MVWRDIISTVEGYHKYCGWITFTTVEGYYAVIWRDKLSSVEEGQW